MRVEVELAIEYLAQGERTLADTHAAAARRIIAAEHLEDSASARKLREAF
jgi:hypothetical protein